MKVVKDSMVLINLAKITLLAASCSHFKHVMISAGVYEETVIAGKKKSMPDAALIDNLVRESSIEVRKIRDMQLLAMANEFNIYGGEAESLALYKQEDADFLISDDYNLRKKKEALNANIIGSLAVILRLRKSKRIDAIKFKESVEKIRKIGWFSNAVLDKVLQEGEKYG